jgi:hypothetical protein
VPIVAQMLSDDTDIARNSVINYNI